MATEIDIEQSTQIAALEKDVELLREEVDKYKDKEHEQFNNRISKLEKWVWGCRTAAMTALQPCLLYTSPSPRDLSTSRMPSSA